MQIDRDFVLESAHRIAWRYKKSTDPNHSDTYTFNESTVLHLAKAIAQRAAEQERKKHLADVELWKAEAATAEKWRGMALAKDTACHGQAVQLIQKEAREQEREVCAQVAKRISDKYAHGHYGNEVDTADEIEAAIRARALDKP